MDTQLQLAYLSTASALLGSIVGGLVTFLTTRQLRAQEWRQDRIDKEISSREQLYSEFLGELGRVLLIPVSPVTDDSMKFSRMYGLVGRIRLSSTTDVQQAAQQLADIAIIRHVGGDPKTLDPKKARDLFIDRARAEIDNMRKKS